MKFYTQAEQYEELLKELYNEPPQEPQHPWWCRPPKLVKNLKPIKREAGWKILFSQIEKGK